MLKSSGSLSLHFLTLICLIMATPACRNGGTDNTTDNPSLIEEHATADPVVIERFCGHCHANPKPESFARRNWDEEVAQGFRFYEAATNLHLEVPPVEGTVAFFRDRAAEELAPPVLLEPESPEASRFVRSPLDVEQTGVAVANLRASADGQTLWACDMRTGEIFSSVQRGPFQSVARPLQLSNPCRSTWTDLDQNGEPELLVSDLGSFFPEDHQKGSLWQFTPQDDWKATSILEGVSRVCDVQCGDLDGDADTDLVVAEFGWRRTGRVLVLWNESDASGTRWRQETLDARHGAIDVPLVDLNGDGLLDVIVLLSQEFELVVAYLNLGEGKFEQKIIYDALDPSFGSSGIQVVDFDQDGDWDVVHTNGDSFDSSDPKPFHGVRWLENMGDYPFSVHEVGRLAGVHQARGADLDADGDFDIVAVCLLPPDVMKNYPKIPSAVWFEQLSGGDFAPHLIESGDANHASCVLVDWDQDDDLDLITTNFRWDEQKAPVATIFENKVPNQHTDITTTGN